MKYEIVGKVVPSVEVSLSRGESMFTQSGGMFYQTEGIKIDTGNLVGFEDSVKYEVEFVKGLGNVIFGGEGLFLTKLTGPGKIILQTMNMNEFALRVGSFIPTSSN